MREPTHHRPLLLGILVLVLGAGAFFLLRPHGAPPAPAAHAVPIATETARRGDIGNYVQALGTVTPVYTVTIYSRVQGQIMSVDYTEGKPVKKNDPLIEIDSRPYVAALLQAQGQLAHDRGVLKQAQIDLVRYRSAWKRNAIQKQLLDDQEQIVVQSLGSVQADEGTLEAAKANLSYCHISSPIDGRVGLRLVDPGNMVQANSTTALVVLTQIRPITVIFSVAEDFLPQIQEQLRLGSVMKVEAYDRGLQRRIASGKFLSLDNQVDTTTGTVRVRAVFDNEDDSLFPNQFVNVRLLLSTQHDATLVATNAVQRGAQGTFVYVISQNGAQKTAKMRPVKPGIVNQDLTAVQGIQPGEVVAINGFDKLQDGAKVTVGNEHELAGKAAGATPKP